MSIRKIIYGLAGEKLRSTIDRGRYGAGFLPRVNGNISVPQNERFPKPFRTAIIISADFELAWGWSRKKCENPGGMALKKALQARDNFPKLLSLFDRFEVPITWATVGHLFLEQCSRIDDKAHPDLQRLSYFRNEFWEFSKGDWFDNDPCCSAIDAPAWYATDLVKSILDAKVEHEIGCHSFSHINFEDSVCTPEVADDELKVCQDTANIWGIELESLVFPGNLAGNFASLKRNGFSAYRFHTGYELDYPRQDEFGMCRIPGGICWEKPKRWPVDAWIKALQRCVDRALETNTVLHLWFHPSCDPVNVDKVFFDVLEYIKSHCRDIWIVTMAAFVEWLKINKF